MGIGCGCLERSDSPHSTLEASASPPCPLAPTLARESVIPALQAFSQSVDPLKGSPLLGGCASNSTVQLLSLAQESHDARKAHTKALSFSLPLKAALRRLGLAALPAPAKGLYGPFRAADRDKRGLP